jgi:hypothetical protein
MPDSVDVERSFPPEAVTALKTYGYTVSDAGSLGRVELIRVREDGNLDIVADTRGTKDSADGY